MVNRTIREKFRNGVIATLLLDQQSGYKPTNEHLANRITLLFDHYVEELKQPEKQEIEIAERKGMLSAYKEVLAFRSTYLYDDYSSLYQQSKELQKEYYEEMGKFLAKKIKELEGKND